MSIERDTIFAPASGAGAAAICVIRLSGPQTHAVMSAMIEGDLPPARQLARRWLVDGVGDRLDDAMVVIFEEGRSFTGEKMAEIHCHGSRAVIAAISARLTGELDCRLAEPGEFARRAFEEKKLGLPEIEGLADLIAAETEGQRRQAMRVYSGSLTDLVERWRADLLRACALIEVTIDWVDEEIPEDVYPEVRQIIEGLLDAFGRELMRSRSARQLRDGFEVAILGAPNTGKSSLLNLLSGQEAAIVSNIPGTTRDIIEVRYDLNGIPVRFLDTAGIRKSDDFVETLGIQRAIERAVAADLRIILTSADTAQTDDICELCQTGDLLVWSKSDLDPGGEGPSISAFTGAGIDDLLLAIDRELRGRIEGDGLLTHLRHQESIERCRNILAEAVAVVMRWRDGGDVRVPNTCSAISYLQLATFDSRTTIRVQGHEDADACLTS